MPKSVAIDVLLRVTSLMKSAQLLAWSISPYVPIKLKPEYGEIYKTFLNIPMFDGSYGAEDYVIGWIR